MISALLPALVAAAGATAGGVIASNSAKKQQANLSAQQQALQQSQADNMAMLAPLMERGASDYQAEAVGSNNAQFGGIQSLMNKFGAFQGTSMTGNAKTVNDIVMEGARQMGVDPKALIQAMTQSGMTSLEAGNQQNERAQGLINGSYYNTPVGRQAAQNLTRNMAPFLSVTGQNQANAMTGTSSAGEVDLITQFLLNGQENARYGDSLLGESVKLSEAGSSRLGGVLSVGITNGQFGATMGGKMTDNLMNIGSSQLINPNDAMRSDAMKASVIGSLIAGNMSAAGMLGQAASGVTSAANSAISGAISGVSSSISDYMKYSRSGAGVINPTVTAASFGG